MDSALIVRGRITPKPKPIEGFSLVRGLTDGWPMWLDAESGLMVPWVGGAAGLSNYEQNHVLDRAFSEYATLYICLLTAACGATDTGSTIVEPTSATYAGYTRVAVTVNTTNFPAASAGSKSNGTAINFPTSTGGTGATVTNWAVCDALTTGNLLWFGSLTTSRSITNGIQPQFAVNTLTVSVA